MSIEDTIAERMPTYVECVSKTRRWAYANWERIQREPDIQGHYKAPYFWASVGDARMAGAHAQLIADRFLQADGDFRMDADRKGFLGFPCTVFNQYLYPNGWLVSGLQKLGAYDLVNRAMPFILSFQDPRHGGFYYACEAQTMTLDRSMMDSSSTSSAGMACLMCGRLAEAERAGDFILRLLDLQPQPDTYYYSCMKSDGSLFTDVFASEDQWDPNSRKQKCLSTQADGGNELTWLIGKPTKFLARLYSATGKAKYLEGARRAFAFFHKLEKNAWTNYASCKTMWAGAELYRLTGESAFAETAVRILDYYCKTQAASGAWVHTLWYKSEEEQSFCWTADITYEYGGEISDVILDLSRRAGSRAPESVASERQCLSTI